MRAIVPTFTIFVCIWYHSVVADEVSLLKERLDNLELELNNLGSVCKADSAVRVKGIIYCVIFVNNGKVSTRVIFELFFSFYHKNEKFLSSIYRNNLNFL